MRLLAATLSFLTLLVFTLLVAVAGPPGAPAAGSTERATLALSARVFHHGGDDGDGDDDDDDDGDGLVRFFTSDPLADPSAVVAGDAAARLTWNAFDAPAFAGDPPGSITARYDASLPAGLFGYRLPAPLGQDDTFLAAAVFVIDPATFQADPDGFFQISWGLWNTATTGLSRTGSFSAFAADTFELIEFDWFPNASPFFGGPFLGPTAFGVAAGDPPDAFANGAFLFDLEARLPLGVPLLAVLEHRPEDDALVTQVWRIESTGRLLPVNGAAGVTRLDGMPVREYSVDAIGLTLWNDGFGGPAPAVLADLTYHALVVRPGAAPGATWPY